MIRSAWRGFIVGVCIRTLAENIGASAPMSPKSANVDRRWNNGSNQCQRRDKRQAGKPHRTKFNPKNNMPKFIIEREIPGAGKLTPEQLQGISQKSCSVLKNLGPQIQWVESYVTDEKIYCVYIAPSEALVKEHAKQGGFPANRISEVRQIIDPTTAEA